MPQIPAEFIPILIQFPIVALVLLGAWIVLKWTDRRHELELERETLRVTERRRSADAEIERIRQDMENFRADYKTELERVSKDYREEITRLRTRNTQLQNELDAARAQRQKGEKS